MMPLRYRLIFSGHEPTGSFPTILEARKAMQEAAKEELAAAKRKWKRACLDRRSPDCVEIRASRHEQSALWTRIAILKV